MSSMSPFVSHGVIATQSQGSALGMVTGLFARRLSNATKKKLSKSGQTLGYFGYPIIPLSLPYRDLRLHWAASPIASVAFHSHTRMR